MVMYEIEKRNIFFSGETSLDTGHLNSLSGHRHGDSSNILHNQDSS